MTDDELEDYAHELMYEAAYDIEWLTIHEGAEDFDDFTDEDAEKISKLIRTATVEISW